tara:strand:- start:1723 stop:2172 length:450 start_codon:yes stop_codon:yes gene_type:complete
MWLYQNKEIKELTDMPEGSFGFIYEVTHLPSGKKYLGRKQLISVTKKVLGKKELALITDKRASKKKTVIKETDWKTYHGSHPEIKQLIKEKKQSEFTREILIFVPTKKQLTYYEDKYLYTKGVIEPGSIYFNDNISGRFFKKDFYDKTT